MRAPGSEPHAWHLGGGGETVTVTIRYLTLAVQKRQDASMMQKFLTPDEVRSQGIHHPQLKTL